MQKNSYRYIFTAMLMLALVLTLAGTVSAQNKVVVIPLGSEPTGNAAAGDVLKDKTFSNASGTGLSGTRPPAPVPKDGPDGMSQECMAMGNLHLR